MNWFERHLNWTAFLAWNILSFVAVLITVPILSALGNETYSESPIAR